MKTKTIVLVVVALLVALATYTVATGWISSDNSWGGWICAPSLAGLIVLSAWTIRNIDAEPAKIILTVYAATALLVALTALAIESYIRAVGITAASVVFVAMMADKRGRAWLNRLVGAHSER